MCGIAGVVGPPRAADRPLLETLVSTLRHRGPDGSGLFLEPDGSVGFAHVRLSIIDLATGAQPMYSPDGRHVIVYNGELYNYRELRVELAAQGVVFRTTSDTEVLLHGLIRYGRPFLDRLNGMFSFVLYDRRERRLFAARDPFGIKPFYYAVAGDRFLFASEVKAILAVTNDARLDPAGFAEYLALTYTLHGRTLFQGIRELPGGGWLERDADGLRFGRHYEFPAGKDPGADFATAVERVRALADDAVRIQLRSDVPVGCHLSGGIDSSLVTCLARRHKPDALHTFSGGFRAGRFYDETPYARAVATAVGSEHHEIFPDGADFLPTMEKLVYHMDYPSVGPSLYPQYHVSKLAAAHLKVVLGGQGGDEAFLGYPYCMAAYLEALCSAGGAGAAFDHVSSRAGALLYLARVEGPRAAAGYLARRRGLSPEALFFRKLSMWNPAGIAGVLHPDRLSALGGHNVYDAFRAAFNTGAPASLMDRILRYLLANYLRGLLQVEDRVSMAVSLESRVPLLDRRLVECSLSLPTLVRNPGFAPKAVLRAAGRGILPDAILARRDKRGFPTPVAAWFGRGPARDAFLALLNEPGPFLAGIVGPATLARLRRGDLCFGPGGATNTWQLFCIELWGRRFRVRA